MVFGAVWVLTHYPTPDWFGVALLLYEIYFAAGMIPALLLRHHRWAIWVHPIAGLIYERDQYMAEQTVRMLETSDASAALAIMGRAHLKGYGIALERRGFRELEATAVLPDCIVSAT